MNTLHGVGLCLRTTIPYHVSSYNYQIFIEFHKKKKKKIIKINFTEVLRGISFPYN